MKQQLTELDKMMCKIKPICEIYEQDFYSMLWKYCNIICKGCDKLMDYGRDKRYVTFKRLERKYLKSIQN